MPVDIVTEDVEIEVQRLETLDAWRLPTGVTEFGGCAGQLWLIPRQRILGIHRHRVVGERVKRSGATDTRQEGLSIGDEMVARRQVLRLYGRPRPTCPLSPR